jgi:hypothetical protein
MQTKNELEEWYNRVDPWDYYEHEDDKLRKHKILSVLPKTYDKSLDIGCGEGFITKDLPSKEIYGYDLSNTAMSRLPKNVKMVDNFEKKYDLVISTGTLYPQYDHKKIYEMIINSSTNHILIAGIEEWLINYDFGKKINEVSFKYRTFNQIIRLYEIGS